MKCAKNQPKTIKLRPAKINKRKGSHLGKPTKGCRIWSLPFTQNKPSTKPTQTEIKPWKQDYQTHQNTKSVEQSRFPPPLYCFSLNQTRLDKPQGKNRDIMSQSYAHHNQYCNTLPYGCTFFILKPDTVQRQHPGQQKSYKCQDVQFVEWSHKAGSKSESVPIGMLKCPTFSRDSVGLKLIIILHFMTTL